MRIRLEVNGDKQDIVTGGATSGLALGLAQLQMMNRQKPTKALARDIVAYKFLIKKKDEDLVERYYEKRAQMLSARQPAKVAEVLDGMGLDWEFK